MTLWFWKSPSSNFLLHVAQLPTPLEVLQLFGAKLQYLCQSCAAFYPKLKSWRLPLKKSVYFFEQTLPKNVNEKQRSIVYWQSYHCFCLLLTRSRSMVRSSTSFWRRILVLSRLLHLLSAVSVCSSASWRRKASFFLKKFQFGKCLQCRPTWIFLY